MTRDEYWNKKINKADGRKCVCSAHGQYECGCDADWTQKEVYVLQRDLEKAKEVLAKWRSKEVVPEMFKELIDETDEVLNA